jgi:hypothetical protein
MSAHIATTAALVVSIGLAGIGLSKWSARRIDAQFSDGAPQVKTYEWNSVDTIAIALVGSVGAFVLIVCGVPT